jgi:hypothetical protein
VLEPDACQFQVRGSGVDDQDRFSIAWHAAQSLPSADGDGSGIAIGLPWMFSKCLWCEDI